MNGVFTETAVPLEYTHSNGICMDFHFAIDIITDLAALLLECKKSGYVNLHDFDEYNTPDVVTHITATHEEYILIIKTLKDFASAPLTYDLSEMVPEDDMKEMAEICDKLRLELEQI